MGPHLHLATLALVGAHHPVGWAARTHAARHTEIAEVFARPELAHGHRLGFTAPRQAAAWLVSLSQ